MRFRIACGFAFVALVGLAQTVSAQDRSKSEIELPVKAAIVNGAPLADLPDLSKFKLEASVKELLAKAVENAAGEKLKNEQADFANPQVAPGKVNWHADFAAAKLASGKSGKPMLHFQLLGQLDQQFT